MTTDQVLVRLHFPARPSLVDEEGDNRLLFPVAPEVLAVPLVGDWGLHTSGGVCAHEATNWLPGSSAECVRVLLLAWRSEVSGHPTACQSLVLVVLSER